ncbi:MAG: hypothetical protein AAGF12_18145 [Myxococcota bacterium]
MVRRPLLAALMIGVTLSGCTEATQTLIRVVAAPDVRQLGAALRLQVIDEGGTIRLDQTIAVPDDELLATVPLVPANNDPSRRFRVIAELLDTQSSVRVRSEFNDGVFAEGRRLTFELRLGSSPDGGIDGSTDADGGLCEDCVDEVSTGWEATCARKGREVFCFGSNERSQLGFSGPGGPVPRRVMGEFDTVSTGPISSSALRDGLIFEWGRDIATPTPAEPTGSFFNVRERNRTRCGLLNPERDIRCFGATGLLFGDEDSGDRGLNRGPYSDFDVSIRHGCAIDMTGQVHCWGANEHGQLGTGSTTNLDRPGRIADDRTFVDVDVGNDGYTSEEPATSCAVAESSALLCWGSNEAGQLGRGTTGASDPFPAPVTVPGEGWRAVSVDGQTVCAIRTGDELYCWGANRLGQLGVDSRDPMRDLPSRVPGAYRSVSVGRHHVCAISTAGELFCWGESPDGRTGQSEGPPVRSPARVAID